MYASDPDFPSSNLTKDDFLRPMSFNADAISLSHIQYARNRIGISL